MNDRRKLRRGLTDDEQVLWAEVVAKAEPLNAPLTVIGEQAARPPTRPLPGPIPIEKFQLGQRAVENPISVVAVDAKTTSNMDRRNFERLKKGKKRVDGKIDLHGMNLAQAHPALNRFVSEAYASGKRLLLVITGKGRISYENGPMPVRKGVLRQQVPQWLAMPPLSSMILEITQATQKHGGGGAYYVYLKRQR